MSTTFQQYITLNTGAKIPSIGLGSYAGSTLEEREEGKKWFLSALKIGYRHFDTAYHYGTEGIVGWVARESGLPREELFITTKLPNHHHHMVSESLEMSLKNGDFDYYDLYLMHWPMATPGTDEDPWPSYPEGDINAGNFITLDKPTFSETWAQMEGVYKSGKVKAIGVCNFSVKTLKTLLETAKIVPAVNQVEMHPHQAQPELIEFCKEKGIILTAYSPTGYETVMSDPTLGKIAKKYNVSVAQICLAWDLARGTTAIPRSSNVERQKANLLDLPKLDEEDITLINTLHRNAYYCPVPGIRELRGHKMAMGWTHEQLGW